MRISEIGTPVEIRFFIRYCGIGFTKVVGSMGVGVVYLNGFDMRSHIVLSRRIIPAPSFDSRFARTVIVIQFLVLFPNSLD